LAQSKKIISGWKIPIVKDAILVVLFHIIITGVHGIAHQQAGVSISDFQSVYVFLVTVAAPITAVMQFLNKQKIQRGGAWLLLVSMLGSLLFGLVYHILLPSSDNIFMVMQNSSLDSVVFTSTAILLVIVDGAGTWVGVRATRMVAKFMP
jgi:glucan phosphoethanolaminetransferase (alkaline phosphatase superfamily)